MKHFISSMTMFFPIFVFEIKHKKSLHFHFGIFPIWNIDQHPVIQNRLLVFTYKQQH